MNKPTISKGSRFRVLHLFGTWLTALGVTFLVILIGMAIASIFTSEGMKLNMNAVLTLPLFAGSAALVVSGQILHWLVSMKNSQDQVIGLLKEIRDLQKTGQMVDEPRH
jgi:hypothetical protein